MHQNMELSLPTAATTQGVLFGGSGVCQSVEIFEAVNIIIGYIAGGNTVFHNVSSYRVVISRTSSKDFVQI
jgi:hypothetical protein